MTPLIANLVNGTAQVFEVSTVLVATMAAVVAFRITQPSAKPRARGTINRHTLTDIGVESGSLTWLR